MAVGNPPQNLSWAPQMFYNDTWIYNASSPFCPDGTSSNWCSTYRGGLYDPSKSSNKQAEADVYAANASPSDTDRSEGRNIWYNAWALDDVHLGATTLSQYPLGMPGMEWEVQNHPQGALGLGRNSTLLTALINGGHIASRSYGLWWGQDGATENAQMDGSLVLGGYDAAKIQGPNITGQIKIPTVGCASGMLLTISDITMDFPNGTHASIVAPHAPIAACLRNDMSGVMYMPYDPYYYTFEVNSGAGWTRHSIGTEWWTPLYETSAVYQGDLTMVFDSGLSVNIPNKLLVTPDRYIDDAGVLQSNTSVADVRIQTSQDATNGDTSMLARQFFSVAYLFVDYDTNTFSLWQANATDDVDLATPGGQCTDIAEVPTGGSVTINSVKSTSTSVGTSTSATTALSSQTALPDPATDAAQPPPATRSLAKGTLIGIIAGSIVLTSLLSAALVFCCLCRRSKSTGIRENSPNGLMIHHSSASSQSDRLPLKAEASDSAMYEMETWRTPGELEAKRQLAEIGSGGDGALWSRRKTGRSLHELAGRTP
ncbi:hypothetical protein B0A48_14419 [Cryoendolithus antarcticus]|uniref:Peptidase A1 domain-containing protein n=1 Tax=Cryoendolithus antarcticus TaxID=1507870 RepID=A0A1V8SJW9_9PEZI|nr:hypothetical protein B0A48_14419 [Cryoendolithus antarcticus]